MDIALDYWNTCHFTVSSVDLLFLHVPAALLIHIICLFLQMGLLDYTFNPAVTHFVIFTSIFSSCNSRIASSLSLMRNVFLQSFALSLIYQNSEQIGEMQTLWLWLQSILSHCDKMHLLNVYEIAQIEKNLLGNSWYCNKQCWYKMAGSLNGHKVSIVSVIRISLSVLLP